MCIARTAYQEETPEDRARELQAEREQRRQEQLLGEFSSHSGMLRAPAVTTSAASTDTTTTYHDILDILVQNPLVPG